MSIHVEMKVKKKYLYVNGYFENFSHGNSTKFEILSYSQKPDSVFPARK